jgi:hypothetical protein
VARASGPSNAANARVRVKGPGVLSIPAFRVKGPPGVSCFEYTSVELEPLSADVGRCTLWLLYWPTSSSSDWLKYMSTNEKPE